MGILQRERLPMRTSRWLCIPNVWGWMMVESTYAPPAKLKWQWENHMLLFVGDTSSNGWFSIVMLIFRGEYVYWSS